MLVARALNQNVETITVLIDSAPKIALLAMDGDDDLVQVPNIIAIGRLALQATGVVGAEVQTLSPDGVVGDEDAALKRHFLDKAQAQGKAEIEPHRVSHDLRRKSVAFVADL
jgi:hypothetical protein